MKILYFMMMLSYLSACQSENSDNLAEVIAETSDTLQRAVEKEKVSANEEDNKTEETKEDFVKQDVPDLNQDWENFKKAVVNDESFDWETFVQIEGQQGEDYAHLFEHPKIVENIKSKKFVDLDRVIFEGEHAYRYRVNVIDKPNVETYDFFFFEDVEKGLRMIGFELFEHPSN